LQLTQSLFAVPKAFAGEAGRIQRNAMATWRQLPGIEILLLGDEDGVIGAAREIRALHDPEVAKTTTGAPLVADVFRRAEAWASTRALLYVNADILLPQNIVDAVFSVREAIPNAVCVGQCLNVDSFGELDGWDPLLERRGTLRGPWGIDYLAFVHGTFPDLPAFALGRAFFDNWLLWNARRRGLPVVDMTEVVPALHQNHDYAHIDGGQRAAYGGEDALRNLELAGGRLHLFNIDDASHRLTDRGLRRNLSAPLRTARPLRQAALLYGDVRHRLGRRISPPECR
jgi:hypothetical protein